MKSKTSNHQFQFCTPLNRPNIEAIFRIHQIHSNTMIELNDNEVRLGTITFSVQKADAIFTKQIRVKIGIQTADCIPLLIYGETKDNYPVVAAIHAGWKGVQLDIVPQCIQSLLANSVRLDSFQFYFGPSIGKCCFEVKNDLISKFNSNAEGFLSKKISDTVLKQVENPVFMDLQSYVENQIQKFGITPSQISRKHFQCTYCTKELGGQYRYESFRRSTHLKKQSGRQWSWIEITPT